MQAKLRRRALAGRRIGTSGGHYMGEALTAAVNHNLNGPGGCNGGFLRKDALLMVTLLSSNYDVSEEPFASAGTPESWHAAILAAGRPVAHLA